jgi:hypothetical protein
VCSPRRLRARGGRAPDRATSAWVVDVDSFVGEVHGYSKQDAAYGYTRQRGYHPILASRADTGAWQTLADYPPTSEAQIAETLLGDQRLIVPRVRTLDAQGELLPTWELFPFLTNRIDALELVESEHCQHAVVELCIRDLKDQALAHFPSGRFFANAAWTVIAALAHNLLRWTGVLGLPGRTVRVARTLRRRLLAIPGRLTRSARRWTLHLPARWPWQHDFIEALTRIRALRAAT